MHISTISGLQLELLNSFAEVASEKKMDFVTNGLVEKAAGKCRSYHKDHSRRPGTVGSTPRLNIWSLGAIYVWPYGAKLNHKFFPLEEKDQKRQKTEIFLFKFIK